MSALSRRAAITSSFAAAIAGGVLLGAGRARADQPGLPDAARPKGGSLKGQLTAEDRAINAKCIDKTMNDAPTGATWKWSNPKSGNSGSVTPTAKAARHGGKLCRTFAEKITLRDGRTETVNGRACKRADGTWNVAA